MESPKNVKTEITDMYDEFQENNYFVFDTRNYEELLLYFKHADRLLLINLHRLLYPLFLNASISSKVRNFDFWSPIFMRKNLDNHWGLFNKYATLKLHFFDLPNPTITLHH